MSDANPGQNEAQFQDRFTYQKILEHRLHGTRWKYDIRPARGSSFFGHFNLYAEEIAGVRMVGELRIEDEIALREFAKILTEAWTDHQCLLEERRGQGLPTIIHRDSPSPVVTDSF